MTPLELFNSIANSFAKVVFPDPAGPSIVTIFVLPQRASLLSIATLILDNSKNDMD
jgi:hypothetical protein